MNCKEKRLNIGINLHGALKTRHVFIIIFLSIGFFQIIACSSNREVKTNDTLSEHRLRLEETWGIRVEGIRLSAADYMLDFRYRVLDPEKAASLFDRKTKPYLIDQASGAKFMVPSPPKVGPLRTSDPPQADKTYFILFANPGKYVKQGNKVTVVIGDFRLENLVVE